MKIKLKIATFLLLTSLFACNKPAYAVNINDFKMIDIKDIVAYSETSMDEVYDDISPTASSSVYDYGDYSYILAVGKAYIKDYRGNAEVLNIPTMLNGYQVIGLYSECFGNAKNLRVINIPSSVKSIYMDTFVNCRNLEEINVDASNNTYASQDGILYSKDFTYFVTVPEAKKGVVNVKNGVKYICDCSFLFTSKVTTVNVPESVIDVGERAFFDTTSLRTINIDPKNNYFVFENGVLYDKNKIEVIKCVDTMTNCVTLPNTVKIIRPYAFFDCDKMVGPLTLSRSLTTIGEYAFANCTSLNGTINFPSGLNSIDKCAFYNCESIERINLPSNLSEIPMWCFAHNTSLKEINIPDSVTKIGECAFFYCIDSESLTLGSGIKAIGQWAFDYNLSLKGDLTIPNNVIDIGTGAFMHSPELDGFIKIGRNVQTIGDSVFYSSNKAKGILFAGDSPILSEFAFVEPNVNYYYRSGREDYNNLIQGKTISPYDEKPSVKFYLNNELLENVIQPLYGRTVNCINTSSIEDYIIEGWYTNSNFTEDSLYDFNSIVMRDTNLYAKVKPINQLSFKTDEFIAELENEYTLDLEYRLQAGASFEDIVWTSSDESIVEVNGGVIVAHKKGEAIITASYDNVTASIIVVGFKDENSLSFELDELTIEIGDNEQIDINYHLLNNGEYSNIVWTSSNENIATIENGKVLGLAKGQTTITASYEDAQDDIIVNVIEANRIDIEESTIRIKEDKIQELSLDCFFNDDATQENIEWTSSDENIAYVQNGVLHAVNAGEVVITAKYKKATDRVNVTVNRKDSFVFRNSSVRMVISDELKDLEYDCYSIDDVNVELSSSDENVVSIVDGKLQLNGYGEAVVTAIYGEASDTVSITVLPENRLMFIEESIEVEYRKTSNLNYHVDYSFDDGGIFEDITFESDNENVVVIQNNKPVIAGVGQANIIIRYNDLSDSLPVTVKSIDKLEFRQPCYVVKRGSTLDIQYDFDSYDNDISNIEFYVDDNNITRLVGHTLYGIGNGTAKITARYKDIERSIKVIVTDEEFVLGDVDGSGVVNGTDAACILDAYNSGGTIDEWLYKVGDMDQNGVINGTDASIILDMYNSGL